MRAAIILPSGLFVCLTIAGLFSSRVARADAPNLSQWLDWEIRGNAVGFNRNTRPFALEHFEIPLEVLRADFAAYLSPAIRNALIFTKQGKPYARWIINPEDDLFVEHMETFLKSRNLDATRHKYFTGRLTGSSSMSIASPNGARFSAKVSTNRTGGLWWVKPRAICRTPVSRSIKPMPTALILLDK